MKLPESIDLHMHTDFSDGADSLEELVKKVQAAGIELFSVTDHDTIKATARLQEMAAKQGAGKLPAFIPGVELSCEDDKGKYHILGYAYGETAQPLKMLIAKTHMIRMEKLENRLEYIKDHFGIVFPEEEERALYRMNNPGKPHIAILLIKHGFAGTMQEAMDNFLNKRKGQEEKIDPCVALEAILESDGIPVLAHPPYGNGSQNIRGEQLDERVKRLKDHGLMGIEGYYSRYQKEDEQEVLGLADKYDLYVTAGSDYHGRNKKNVALKSHHLQRVSDGDPRLHRFLELILSGKDSQRTGDVL